MEAGAKIAEQMHFDVKSLPCLLACLQWPPSGRLSIINNYSATST